MPAFSLVHTTQGWPVDGIIALIAAAAHLIGLATGNPCTSMAVHVQHDLFAGMILMRLARRDHPLA